jgi:hypothetical protein
VSGAAEDPPWPQRSLIDMPFSRARIAWLLAVVAAGVCAALVAGCGGSSAPKGATSTVTASQVTPGPSGKPIPTGSIATGSSKSSATTSSHGSSNGSSGGKSGDQTSVAETKTTSAKTSPTGSKPTASDKVTPSSESGSRAAPEPHPCGLVPLSEAQSITGGEIAGRVEAPLGPTCIYHLSNSKSDITMAVESMSFSQVTRHMSSRKAIDIAGRHAFCGKLGDQMLFVPLSGGKLLNVTAPCTIAQQFAAKALTRLQA